MATETAAQKAARYLAEGRLIVTAVQPGFVSAVCRGDGTCYSLGWDGAWRCSCPCPTDRCCHLRAIRLIVAVDLPRDPP